MDAIVTAGGITPDNDPLFPHTKFGYKSLIQIKGKAMVQWVLDALSCVPQIDQVYVVGLPSDIPLHCSHPLVFLPDQGDSIRNICFAAQHKNSNQDDLLLIVSGDIPAVQSTMIDWFIQRLAEGKDDFYYNVIERQTMETRYPDSRRTYVRFKDYELCGGDMNAIRRDMANLANPITLKLYQNRKNPIQQASLFGIPFLFKLLTRQLRLHEAVKTVSQKLKIKGQAVMCPFAEIGMDVDKLFQLEILKTDLEK
jgi:GTP:adenosylcobinamide-phosphate guanylyltransferase